MTTNRRKWKTLRKPPSWLRPSTRVLWHFIMSYDNGQPGTVIGQPFQTEAGDWLVLVRLDADGREIRAAIESLDQVQEKSA